MGPGGLDLRQRTAGGVAFSSNGQSGRARYARPRGQNFGDPSKPAPRVEWTGHRPACPGRVPRIRARHDPHPARPGKAPPLRSYHPGAGPKPLLIPAGPPQEGSFNMPTTLGTARFSKPRLARGPTRRPPGRWAPCRRRDAPPTSHADGCAICSTKFPTPRRPRTMTLLFLSASCINLGMRGSPISAEGPDRRQLLSRRAVVQQFSHNGETPSAPITHHAFPSCPSRGCALSGRPRPPAASQAERKLSAARNRTIASGVAQQISQVTDPHTARFQLAQDLRGRGAHQWNRVTQ